MRIAFASSSFDRHHRLRISIVEALRASGHECKIFGLYFSNTHVEFPDEAEVIRVDAEYRNFVSKKYQFNNIKKRYLDQIQNFGPDCIVLMDPETLFIVTDFNFSNTTRTVYAVQEFHGFTTHSDIFRRLWVYKTEQLAMFNLDHIVVLSNEMKQHMQNRYINTPTIEIVSNAYAQDWSKAVYDGQLHQSVNLESDKRILLYHGYFAPHRGLEYLADLSVNLPDDWHFVCMGWGPLKQYLEDHVSEKMTLIPPAAPERLNDVISGASIGTILYEPVNKNHTFSTPNKLFEYGAANVPMLVANLPLIAKEVNTYDMGWVTDMKTGADENILAIFNPEKRNEIAQKSRNCLKFQTVQKNLPDLTPIILGH